MAITIPTTRSILPEQNASQEIDPSRQFGNQVAAPINMPDVPRGMAGIQIDDSAEQNAYANVGHRIGSAVSQVIDDRAKMEEALRRANETVEFEKAKIDFDNAASEAMQTAKMLRQSGDLTDDEDAKGYYETKLLQLRDQHLPEGKYKSVDVDAHARIYSHGVLDKYKDSFRDHVIIPEQSAKYLKTINETNNQRSVQALNLGRMSSIEQIVPNLQAGLQAIKEQYANPALQVLMKPEQLLKAEQDANLQFLQSYMTGVEEREINFSDPKADKLVLAKKRIANMQLIKKVIFGNDEIAKAFGGNVDNAVKKLNDSILTQQGVIERGEEIQERKAEAARNRAESHAIAAAKSSASLYGHDSPYFQNFNKQPAIVQAAIMEGMDGFFRRENTVLGQAQAYANNFAGKPGALPNPSPKELKMVDSHFEISKRQIAGMKPEEQQEFMKSNYFSVGVVPTELKDNLTRELNSQDPNVVSKALTTLAKIEKVSPSAIASAFKPEQKSMLLSFKSGIDPLRIIDFRDKKNDVDSKPAAEVNKAVYATSKVKNEVDFKKKISGRLEDIGSSFFEFGGSVVSTPVVDEVADRVKVYVSRNIPFDDAVKQAYQDISLTAGRTELAGPKRTIVRFSPEVMTGQSSSQIRKKLDPLIEHIKAKYNGYQDIKNEDFILVPFERTSKGKPEFQIWFRDKYGNPLPVRNNNFQPVILSVARDQ